jgi:hypothetical protein
MGLPWRSLVFPRVAGQIGSVCHQDIMEARSRHKALQQSAGKFTAPGAEPDNTATARIC